MKTRWLTRAADLACDLLPMVENAFVEYQHTHADDEGNAVLPKSFQRGLSFVVSADLVCGRVHGRPSNGDQAGTPEAEGERVFGRVFWDAREGAQPKRSPLRGSCDGCGAQNTRPNTLSRASQNT